jgi:hypothetical protein
MHSEQYNGGDLAGDLCTVQFIGFDDIAMSWGCNKAIEIPVTL